MKCCSPTSEPLSPSRRVLRAILIVAILAIILIVFLRPRSDLCEITGATMGTTYTVKCVIPPASAGLHRKALAVHTQSALQRVNSHMSTYLPDSELSCFNANPDTTPFAASPMVLDVFKAAMQVSEESGGAFDITVGPIVNAYGFGPDTRPESQPSNEELTELYKRVGYKMIQVDGNKLTKQRPDIYCDLSAIAKGFAVDLIAETFEGIDIDSYMIEVGGEVRTCGAKPNGEPWRIGIQRPDENAQMVHRVIELRDKAMATSGDYRNFYIVDGKRISHTIDPRTGKPVAHNLASVTVIHDQCMLADAWATALMVLGPDEGYDLAVQKDMAASFIVRTGDEFTEKSTPVFDEITQP